MTNYNRSYENNEKILYYAKNSKRNINCIFCSIIFLILLFILFVMFIVNIVSNSISNLLYFVFPVIIFIQIFRLVRAFNDYKNNKLYLTKTSLVILKKNIAIDIKYTEIKNIKTTANECLILTLKNSLKIRILAVENLSELILKIKEYDPAIVSSVKYIFIILKEVICLLLYPILIYYIIILDYEMLEVSSFTKYYFILPIIFCFLTTIINLIKKLKILKMIISTNFSNSQTYKTEKTKEKEPSGITCPICGSNIPFLQNSCPNCKIYYK